MPHLENNSQTDTIEAKLAYWLDTFEAHVNKTNNTQENLHDCIVQINEQNFTKAQKQAASDFLNDALSLSFLIKNYKEDVEKFISYHSKLAN